MYLVAAFYVVALVEVLIVFGGDLAWLCVISQNYELTNAFPKLNETEQLAQYLYGIEIEVCYYTKNCTKVPEPITPYET